MAKQNDFSTQKEEFIVEKNLFIHWFLYKHFLSNLKCLQYRKQLVIRDIFKTNNTS